MCGHTLNVNIISHHIVTEVINTQTDCILAHQTQTASLFSSSSIKPQLLLTELPSSCIITSNLKTGLHPNSTKTLRPQGEKAKGLY